MNVIVDYGVGNLSSLVSAFEQIGLEVVVSGDTEDIRKAQAIILPGVGAFGAAMEELKKRNLVSLLKEKANDGTLFFGVCLGMQLLFDNSDEKGFHEGLGLIEGVVREIPATVKVPHMGWNKLTFQQKDPVLAFSQNGDYVYYVHSHYVQTDKEYIVADSEYGVNIPGIVRKKNIIGMQFHPEKSAQAGLHLLQAFKELISQ